MNSEHKKDLVSGFAKFARGGDYSASRPLQRRAERARLAAEGVRGAAGRGRHVLQVDVSGVSQHQSQ